jgi:hypothetical protein
MRNCLELKDFFIRLRSFASDVKKGLSPLLFYSDKIRLYTELIHCVNKANNVVTNCLAKYFVLFGLRDFGFSRLSRILL